MITINNPIGLVGNTHHQFTYVNNEVALSNDTTTDFETKIEEFIDQYQVEITDKGRKSPLGKIRTVMSFTGDDVAIAGINKYVTCVQLSAAEVIWGRIISPHDTNISEMMGNYTEGYVMHAPHKNATFDSTIRRYRGSGVPMVFDTMKLKQFLPNTKGSYSRVDLADKMEQAFKQTEWMDNAWLGKPYAELMKVMILTVFDFRDSRSFPMLYATEGGCGGTPPFDNLDTFKNALYFFRGGRAKNGILEIMSESTIIQKGHLKPSKGIATQTMHLAQTGIPVGKIRGFLRDKEYQNGTPEEKYEIINQISTKEPIPEDLLDKSTMVEPENKLSGAIIAEMRNLGYVMTELDVRMSLVSRIKFAALLGDKPMGEVLHEMEELKRKEKAFPLAGLIAQATIDTNPGDRDEKGIASEYYRMRSNRADITGFSYAGVLRIFKSEDVKAFLKYNSFGLADEIIQSLPTRNDYGTNHKYGRSKVKHDLYKQVVSGKLSDLIRDPPPGVGPDDARIGLTAQRLPPEIPLYVITEDKGMLEILPSLHRNTYGIGYKDYMDARERMKINKQQGNQVVGIKVKRPFSSDRDDAYVDTEATRKNKGKKVFLCYDFANINRRTEAIAGGRGFFPRKIAESIDYGRMEWEDFKELPCFESARMRAGRYFV